MTADVGKTASPSHGTFPAHFRLPTPEEEDEGCDVEDGDLMYDDGSIVVLCTLQRDRRVVMHTFYHRQEANKGKGLAEQALRNLKAEFGYVVANGVEDDSHAESFWLAMVAKGLVDEIRQYAKGVSIFPRP